MSLVKIDSIELTKYVLSKVGQMNHLKLQKIVYYIQAWHLAYFNEELIEDKFEAWVHGPVSRKIWNHYKSKANVYDSIELTEDKEVVIRNFGTSLAEDQIDLIKSVLNEYGNLSAFQLEELTHSESPWQKTRNGYGVGDVCEKEIDNTIMQSYYRGKLYDPDTQAQEA